jgi:cephalosporin hydroxylase
MIEGSSISNETIEKVKDHAKGKQKIIVCLDSNHTHEHVLEEMRTYSPFVNVGSYLIVFDTIVQHLPDNYIPNRPWGPGNNPMTAVDEFLKWNNNFSTDESIDNKLLISVAPKGYLKRVK